MTTTPQRNRRTDGQTTCHGNIALCIASRGKKVTFSWDHITRCSKCDSMEWTALVGYTSDAAR